MLIHSTQAIITGDRNVAGTHPGARPKKNDKTLLRLLLISSDEMVAFQERVGYRYCSHKQQRLVVAAAYYRAVNYSLEQAAELVRRVDEITVR